MFERSRFIATISISDVNCSRLGAIRKELELYSKTLAAKPEIIALSKRELTEVEPIAAELSSATGQPVLAISAVMGAGLRDLMRSPAGALDAFETSKTGS